MKKPLKVIDSKGRRLVFPPREKNGETPMPYLDPVQPVNWQWASLFRVCVSALIFVFGFAFGREWQKH